MIDRSPCATKKTKYKVSAEFADLSSSGREFHSLGSPTVFTKQSGCGHSQEGLSRGSADSDQGCVVSADV